MAATPLLGLELPVTGTLSGTWGDTVNNSITSLLDTAVAGTTTLSTDADVTLTTTASIANQSRSAILLFTGNRTVLRTVIAPALSKTYVVQNLTTGGFSVKLAAPGPTTGVTILNGEEALVAWSGSDFVRVSTLGGPITGSTGTFTDNVQMASLNGGQLAGLRNKFTNGNFLLDQRNSGAIQTITAANPLAYTVDRFYAYCTGANVTGQRIAGTAPNAFVYRFTGAASVTKIVFAQRIENVNGQDLAGQTATLAADFSNALLTTVTWSAFYANTANAFGTVASPTRTLIATGTFTVTSVLTRYSTSIAIPAAATTGIEIEFSVAAQTSGTWVIGNTQLEIGPVRTTFEQRPLALETQLCGSPDNTTQFGVSPGTSVVATSVNGGQLAGLRNKVINGDMTICQRATSTAGITGSTQSFLVDRFRTGGQSTAAVVTTSHSSDVPSGLYGFSARIVVTTADTSIASTDVLAVVQLIEGYNIRDLFGTTFTLSFWVRSSKTGIHCVAFTNSGLDRSYVVEYTISVANTWEYKTITVSGGLTTSGTWDLANGTGVSLRFALMAGSSFQTTAGAWNNGNFFATSSQVNCLDTIGNIFAITNVQLEVGPVATPFEQLPIGMELALCQRYFETNITFAFASYALAGANLCASVPFAVVKRATPITITNITDGSPVANVNVGALSFSAGLAYMLAFRPAAITGSIQFGDIFSASSEL